MVLPFCYKKIRMIIKLYEYEVPFNQYSDYIYILILFKLNYIPYKIHKCVNFKI